LSGKNQTVPGSVPRKEGVYYQQLGTPKMEVLAQNPVGNCHG